MAGSLLLTAGALAWLSFHNFTRTQEAFQRGFAPVIDARKAIADSSRVPLGKIAFDDAMGYAQTFREVEETATQLASEMETGDPVYFWMRDRRRTTAGQMRSVVQEENALVVDVLSVLDRVSALSEGVSEQLAAGAHARSDAATAFGGDADVRGMDSAATNLGRAISGIQRAKGSVAAAGPAQLTERPEAVRVALLEGFTSALDEELERLEARAASVAQARQLLAGYKQRVLREASAGMSLAQRLSTLTRTAAPAVQRAFDDTEQLRRLLRDARRPMDLGGMGALLGGRVSISPLDVVTRVDPTTASAIQTLEGLCAAIETVHGEIGTVSSRVSPVVRALDAFRGSGSRADLRQLAHAAPDAASYFSSGRGMFDTPLQRIAESRKVVRDLRAAVSRLGFQYRPVQRHMNNALDLADRIIVMAGTPFDQAKSTIVASAETLTRIDKDEASYLNNLRALSSGGSVSTALSAAPGTEAPSAETGISRPVAPAVENCDVSGDWELVRIEVNGETRQGRRSRKTVGNGRFSITTIRLDPRSGQGPDTLRSQGTYEVSGRRYREHLTAADESRMIGQTYEFECRVEGGYWYSEGRMRYLTDPNRSYLLTEVWRRLPR